MKDKETLRDWGRWEGMKEKELNAMWGDLNRACPCSQGDVGVLSKSWCVSQLCKKLILGESRWRTYNYPNYFGYISVSLKLYQNKNIHTNKEYAITLIYFDYISLSLKLYQNKNVNTNKDTRVRGTRTLLSHPKLSPHSLHPLIPPQAPQAPSQCSELRLFVCLRGCVEEVVPRLYSVIKVVCAHCNKSKKAHEKGNSNNDSFPQQFNPTWEAMG